MRIKIAPSILSADFSCLGKEIKKIERAGADMIHIDVMDGHFVPNITIGPAVIKYIRRLTRLPLDVHLMIERPQRFIDSFVAAGSDMITVHIETVSKSQVKNLSRRLIRLSRRLIRLRRKKLKLSRKNIKLGISLNPSTPLKKIKDVLGFVDFVLVMSVNPGFGGQKFMPSVLPKIAKLRSFFGGDIAVDGGINDRVAPGIIQRGANILAIGSYIFGAKNTRLAIEKIRNAGRSLNRRRKCQR